MTNSSIVCVSPTGTNIRVDICTTALDQRYYVVKTLRVLGYLDDGSVVVRQKIHDSFDPLHIMFRNFVVGSHFVDLLEGENVPLPSRFAVEINPHRHWSKITNPCTGVHLRRDNGVYRFLQQFPKAVLAKGE